MDNEEKIKYAKAFLDVALETGSLVASIAKGLREYGGTLEPQNQARLEAYKGIWNLMVWRITPENVDAVISGIEGCTGKSLPTLIAEEREHPYLDARHSRRRPFTRENPFR